MEVPTTPKVALPPPPPPIHTYIHTYTLFFSVNCVHVRVRVLMCVRFDTIIFTF